MPRTRRKITRKQSKRISQQDFNQGRPFGLLLSLPRRNCPMSPEMRYLLFAAILVLWLSVRYVLLLRRRKYFKEMNERRAAEEEAQNAQSHDVNTPGIDENSSPRNP